MVFAISCMASLMGPTRREILLSMKNLFGRPYLHHISLMTPTRTYISEMRKSAFEGNILRLIRNEILYEVDHFTSRQPVVEYKSFVVDERPGEQWIRMRRNFEGEEIKIEVTMFDGSVPVPKSSGDPGEEVQLHISCIVNISKANASNVLQFVCSAWPDNIEIREVFLHRHDHVSNQLYTGPNFRELDDQLQESLYQFLEERGIDDELTVFLHQCMQNKDKSEFIRWMERVKFFIEKK